MSMRKRESKPLAEVDIELRYEAEAESHLRATVAMVGVDCTCCVVISSEGVESPNA